MTEHNETIIENSEAKRPPQARLDQALCARGLGSRKEVCAMIREGLVQVNGVAARSGGQKIGLKRDQVTVRGAPVNLRAHIYIMLHKPRGYVTTMGDRHAARMVAELVADFPSRTFPVGRLDKDSEGLLLMTNDGALANALTHPASHVPKVYRVTLRGQVSDAQRDKLSTGMELDGRRTQPIELRVLAEEPDRTVLQLTLREGRNRQIRRMCEALNLEVLRLKRTALGPLKLGLLPAGQWRELTAEEVKRLKSR
jgi:23S rRNA pseudouridine2605 synthase